MLKYTGIIFKKERVVISMLGQQEQSGLFLQLSRIIKGINFYKSNTLFNIVSDHQEDNHRSYL
ncbi:hypothetical protein [Spiroplasma endosymbiont of Seladonia tumulorum]|uniref:hypothetical protein n=1 Tax=Spiroplasma endosymbiont of Seladonia tumulorum TaxID=3066321 RepID=UPI0030CF301C